MDLNNKVATLTDTAGVIGHMVIWKIAQMDIRRDVLQNALDSNNLSHLMPKKIRSFDAFRRATSSLKSKKTVGHVETELMVEETYVSDEEIQRQVVVKTVNKSQKDNLNYNKGQMLMTFDRKKETIQYQYNDLNMLPLKEKVEDLFNMYQNYHSDRHIRDAIGKLLDKNDAVKIRDGAYFIPIDKEDTTHNLHGFITELAKVNNATISNKFPLIDCEDSVDTITSALEVNIREATKDLQLSFQNGTLTVSKLNQKKAEYQAELDKFNRYQERLNKKNGEMAASLGLIDTTLSLIDEELVKKHQERINNKELEAKKKAQEQLEPLPNQTEIESESSEQLQPSTEAVEPEVIAQENSTPTEQSSAEAVEAIPEATEVPEEPKEIEPAAVVEEATPEEQSVKDEPAQAEDDDFALSVLQGLEKAIKEKDRRNIFVYLEKAKRVDHKTDELNNALTQAFTVL